MVSIKSGGIIGCVGGFDKVSVGINLGTLGIPGVDIHHVAIVCDYDGQPLIYESTTSERPVCFRKKEFCKGVQCHTVDEFTAIPFYNKLWYYPLRCELYPHEQERLSEYLGSLLGTPYDMPGAIHAGGVVFSILSALMRGEDLSSLFCSEMDMAALVRIGRTRTHDASRWSPNKLCRYLVRSGICSSPLRLK